MFPIPVPTLDLERQLADQHHDLIVGFDEVGRGALAGPVMVGAVALWAADLGSLSVPQGLADSKLLTPRHRESLVEPLRRWCAADAIGQSTNTEIDKWGISHALGIAALRALHGLEETLGLDGHAMIAGHATLASTTDIGAILDGPFDYITPASNTFDAPTLAVPATVITHVKADQLSVVVAAASVLAKVTRDALMVSLAAGNERYAPYGWTHNKGYGSASHRAAIARYGLTPLHRSSWHLM